MEVPVQHPSGGNRALAGVRVVDLTTNHAAYAGRLLADLGADVIRVETPTQGPAADEHTSRFLNIGKKRIAVDNTPAGRETLAKLLEAADIIFDTPAPGGESIPIDVEALRAAQPAVTIVSIFPFGHTGPLAGHVATDLTVLASGGLLSLGGYADSEPIAIGGEQAIFAAGIFAAVAALADLVDNEGQGRWIEVSAQECVAFALEDAVPEWYIARRVRRRHGDAAREAGTGIYPCADGYVSTVAGRLGTAKAWAALCKWIRESKTPGSEELADPRWEEFTYRQSREGIDRFARIFAQFSRELTKQDLYNLGQQRQIAIAPVNTIDDLLRDPQLAASGFFRPFVDPETGQALTIPGPPYRLSRTPASPARATAEGAEATALFSRPERHGPE